MGRRMSFAYSWRNRRGDPKLIAALQLPLLFDEPEIVVQEPVRVRLDTAPLPPIDLASPASDAGRTWTVKGILQLHSALLEESLKALTSRGNPKMKCEILDWIFDDEIRGFSFRLCCLLEGFDFERIRDVVSRAIEKVSTIQQ